MGLNLTAYRAALAERTARERAERARFERTADAQRAKSPEERALERAEQLESYPELCEMLAGMGANASALVEYHAANVAHAARPGTERTTHLDSRRTTENGAVPARRTFGRGTEADAYSLLDGAPVGCPESADSQRRERAAAADEARWARQNARADAGVAVTRKSLRNAKRAAARAARGPR